MKKCELLSPAGNMEMLKYAVQYGADAVYLAGTKFGARKFATNFDEDELQEAVKYAHSYNVKVYITINTLIYDDEVNSFVENVKLLHRLNVDAVLVQDYGMINLIRKIAPNLEIHASTQFHNDGPKTLELLRSLGVKRAVLDREMSLQEIKDLPKMIELEVFCHGALCVSYSGQCLFSSQVIGRSGNRGECAGLCRLPYKIKKGSHIEKDAAYHLSLKDLSVIDSVCDLIEAGASSLKIEGRMKSPEYVGYLTKIYRKLIDSYYDNRMEKITQKERKNIALLFNRGLTKGFLNDATSEEIVNLKSPNHIGISAGAYRAFKDKIELHLTEDIQQGDTIRFQEANLGMTINFLYDSKHKLINCASKGTTVYVDNFLQVENKGELRLVAKNSLTREIAALPRRKVSIDMSFKAKEDSPIVLEVREKETVKIKGPIPERAQNRPLTRTDIERQLSKTGDTIYAIEKLDISLDDGLFINLKDINELRRRALSLLDAKRTAQKEVTFEEYTLPKSNQSAKKSELLICVDTEDQYLVARRYTPHIFTTNEQLLHKYEAIHPKYASTKDHITKGEYMITHYGSLLDIEEGDFVFADYPMNVTNAYTVASLIEKKLTGITLSVEMSEDRIENISKQTDSAKIVLFIYGKIELMKMKYNPIEKGGDSLVDRNGSTYKIKRDNHYNYLMSSKPLNMLAELDKYKKLHIGYFRLDFTDETGEECKKILEKAHKNYHKE